MSTLAWAWHLRFATFPQQKARCATEESEMSKQTIALAAALALVGVSTGRAVDRVQTTAKEKPMVMGKIISISPQQIEVELLSSGGQTRQIPVNEIKEVKFEDEPGALFQARKAITDGEYGDALDKLGKLTPAETARRELATEIEYLKAYCAAELALSGNGDITEAGSQMLAFAKAHETSYHYLQACELIGNLLVAKGAYGQAEAYYRKLAEAPWPDYKMRAGIAMGRVMLAQGKAAEAAKAFDEVIASEAGGDLAEAQRMAAQVGKARTMAAGNQVDGAIRSLQKIIADADADNEELHALAYNALGTALRKAHKPQEALLAFLHVDLLYNSNSETHAEALANLEQLFTELHKPEHAKRIRTTLDQRYKNSRWATGAR
jgi:tetratricopeptide (TPR) repeat protein